VKGTKLRYLHILRKVQVYKMSQAGCLVKHQAYGEDFCLWLFYGTGNCRELFTIAAFKWRDCVYFLMLLH